ncbi:MAG: hypothetical protein HY901_27505 [Deltaproteobacteria bacterium]|nr:hypothetical protein [Deltaproteobacteria bacterium]
MADARVVECHGVSLSIPASWRDETLFRFALPPPGPTDPGAPPFRTNLIASRRSVDPALNLEDALRDLLATAPPKAREAPASFKVRVGHLAKQEAPPPEAPPVQLGSGLGTLQEHRAAWLDVSFFARDANRRLFQRQILSLPGPGSMVVLTLTSDEENLETLTRQVGFTVR